MKNRTFEILIIVMLAIYIVNPADIIADPIPVIGILDDMAAVILLLKQFISIVNPAIE